MTPTPEQREVRDLLAFVALALFISTLAILAAVCGGPA